ncbi:aKG-HExxH-type peptide beta-hydroxylase [Streptomyces bungoensis]
MSNAAQSSLSTAIHEGLAPLSSKRVMASAAAVCDYSRISTEDARAAFMQSLNALQCMPFKYSESGRSPHFDFGEEEGSAGDLIKHIAGIGELPTKWTWGNEQKRKIAERASCALDLIESLDSDLSLAIRHLVGNLSFGKITGFQGGSISSLLGVIWIGLHERHETWEFAEIIVHETIHQCLFLEDMVHGVFQLGEEAMAEPDYLVTTALLRTPRGFDKAFHSAYVAIALARFHRARRDFDKAAQYLRPVLRTYQEMRERQGCLTEHGKYLIRSFGSTLTLELNK